MVELRMVAVAAVAVVALALAPAPAAGQGPALSCTAALVTSFAPCFNFITSSSNGGGGGSPTAGCCGALAAVVNTSASCACLMLTGGVPLGLGMPINRTLAVSLPRACNSSSVPLQCKDTSTQIPAPGPVALAPSIPTLPSTPPAPSTQPESPVEPTATTPPASQGQARPQVVPSSARRAGARVSVMMPASAVLLAAVAMLAY